MITEKDKEIRLQHDMDIIVEGILGVLEGKPKAILLCGGYGRGEGAWYTDRDGNLCTYNDYDLAVITETPMSRGVYSLLRKELAEKVGIRWIDIDCYTPSQLHKMKSTIHNIDLLYASKVIWGDEQWNTKPFIPKLRKEEIGFFDIEKLYRTRMWTLLGSWEGDFRDLDPEETMFFRNQMAKCILASCDMRLVLEKEYETSYVKRVEKICALCPQDERLCKLARWAIHEKQNPSYEKMPAEAVKDFYDDVYNLFIDSSRLAFGNKSKYYLDPQKTKGYLLTHTLNVIMTIYGLLRGHKWYFAKRDDIFCAQNYVLLSYSSTGIYNSTYLKKASDILQKWNYIKEPLNSWPDLRTAVADARNRI